jgi:hypothetical protein
MLIFNKVHIKKSKYLSQDHLLLFSVHEKHYSNNISTAQSQIM